MGWSSWSSPFPPWFDCLGLVGGVSIYISSLCATSHQMGYKSGRYSLLSDISCIHIGLIRHRSGWAAAVQQTQKKRWCHITKSDPGQSDHLGSHLRSEQPNCPQDLIKLRNTSRRKKLFLETQSLFDGGANLSVNVLHIFIEYLGGQYSALNPHCIDVSFGYWAAKAASKGHLHHRWDLRQVPHHPLTRASYDRDIDMRQCLFLLLSLWCLLWLKTGSFFTRHHNVIWRSKARAPIPNFCLLCSNARALCRM